MLKKLSLPNNFFYKIWLGFHLLILAAFTLTLFIYKEFTMDADSATMLPSASTTKASKIAEKAMIGNMEKSVYIIAGNKDFSEAKKAAETAYNQLLEFKNCENPKFKSLDLYADASTISSLQDFLSDWRVNLLSKGTLQKISDSPEDFASSALSEIYSGFTLSSLENIDSDPFLFDEENVKNYLSIVSNTGTAMKPYNGVLANNVDGVWYVLIRGELTEAGMKMASKTNAIPDIYRICLTLETDETRFAFTGMTFDSYKSSNSASREISIISGISIAVIVIMLLLVFKSGLPILGSILSIAISIFSALLATHAVFGNIHMMALLFGTSLIGSSIDYSLHFFINWKCSKALDTGEKIRKHLFHGLFLSLVSTELCYILLMFAPYPMLKQVAVFSFTGILSSFLTTTGLFPLLKLPLPEKRRIPFLEKIEALKEIPQKTKKILGIVLIGSLALSSICVLVVNHSDVKIQNDIGSLYKLEGRLKDDMELAQKVLDYNPSCWLIISGDSAQEVLELEEKIIPTLPDNAICTSEFIPSVKKQREAFVTAEKLLPLIEDQFEYLGFDETAAEDYKKDFQLSKEKFITPENELPETLGSITDMLWIGEVDSKYYSIILPSLITDEEFYINLASSNSDIHYANRITDISLGLDNLTRIIVILFALAFVLISIIMKFCYNWRDTLKIVSIPVMSVLVIVTTFVLSGLKIEFFCITGVILVFGLGLDYIIYAIQNKGNKTETFAIALSFLTTAISFGALALSSFIPIHILGLSIFSGLVTAFFCTIL